MIPTSATAFHNYYDQLGAGARDRGGGTQTTVVKKHFVVQERSLEYRFSSHFHPYVAELVRRLIAGSVRGLQDADTDYRTAADGTTEMLAGAPRPVLYEPIFSAQRYAPSAVVAAAPVRELDFAPSGAYSVYNWELFFHVPLTVAMHLTKNGRFEDAERWFRLIFDPTDTSEAPAPERFWKVRPFQSSQVRMIEEILVNLSTGADPELRDETIASIAGWKDAPFRPHAVARHRQSAYMLKTVMAYLDHLIAWGDALFRQDTRETINDATQLYVLAANILGPRPQAVPTKGSVRPQTYANLREDLDRFGNALREVEVNIPFDLTPHPGQASDGDALATVRSIGNALYFCVPRNDRLLAYWDTVADRLFKIRNSLNLLGIFRQLALFEPPIDPALLAKAAAAGLDVGAVVAGLNQPLPLVRFPLLAQRAAEICQEVKSLGAQLLATIEKEDGEALAVLRAQHERSILGLAESVRYAQLQEAVKAREGLERSLAGAVERYTRFEELLGARRDEVVVPALEALDHAGLASMRFSSQEPELGRREVVPDIARGVSDDLTGGKKVSTHEAQELDKLAQSQTAQDVAAGLEAIGAFLNLIPMFSADGKPLGMGAGVAIGGMNISQLMSALASVSRAVGGRLAYEAGRSGRIASFARREEEWAVSSNAAAAEIDQLHKQLRAAQIRESVAERELSNHRRQMENAEEIERFLTDEREGKRTNQAYYAWMKREVRGLYGQCFQLAFDVAKKAERALQQELGDPGLQFIEYGYLAGRDGLLAGERLWLDIKRMEMAHLDLREREYELTKHVSLREVNPRALLQLRSAGRCTVVVPEELFDFDGPGHYFRRIKTVSLSIPSVTGPYSSVSCTLTLLKSSIRLVPLLRDGAYPREGAEDDRFSDHFGTSRPIVTSSAQNDSGLFEVQLQGEQRLPWEGAGAVSEWQLELPSDVRQFDYDTITDVILHLRYTAREGGELLRRGAVANLTERIAAAQTSGSVRLFSVRHDFPAEWARFKSVAIGGQTATAPLTITLGDQHYPFWSAGRRETLKRLLLFARAGSDVAIRERADGTGTSDSLTADPSSGLRAGELEALPLPAPTGELTLFFGDNSMSDLWIAPAWGSRRMNGRPAAGPGAAAEPASGAAPGPSPGDEAAADPAAGGPVAPPVVSVPKGGGAIRGIGEKFSTNPATGTGSLAVPIPASPGRDGFGPRLTLAYSSGAGDGPFGRGWQLGLPEITRKADKGVPRYRDSEESDVFILSDAEDLVPVLDGDAGWRRLEVAPEHRAPGYRIDRYRPRTEGLYARIERWTRSADGDVHWRSISRDNVTSIYGRDGESRIADPADPGRVFSWLICETHDDRGNVMAFEYKPEDHLGADAASAHERHRAGAAAPAPEAARHPKRILYGNRISRLVDPDQRDRDWMFELVFDYGEHDGESPTPGDAGDWTARLDPFSTYRPGFEVRTYRLCRRILVFHHFEGEADVGGSCLVRSLELAYRGDRDRGERLGSLLASVTLAGHRRRGGGYLTARFPPLELAYGEPDLRDEVRDVPPGSLESLPAGLATPGARWVDLDGEGIAGVLTQHDGAAYYTRNRGPGGDGRPDLGPPEEVAPAPAPALVGAGQQLLDLGGDGQLDLVALGGPAPGFYERTADADWEPFRPFASLPNLRWDDPNLRLVDLTGDGHADVLLTEGEAITWHPSLEENGFDRARRVGCERDEDRGPRLVFADGTESVHVADMSGDGLSDLVRIRNGDVSYWPNLGHGRFGPKVTMDASPWLDAPDQLDQRRVRLADVDGSGPADLIYLGRDGARIFLNEAGNAWAEQPPLASLALSDGLADVAAIDLLGSGTTCLVWSSPSPGEAGRAMRYADLLGGRKPHLLERIDNNLGAQTRIDYAPSTRFYLADRERGRPWVTRLPFPVHCVERVRTIDRISGNVLTTSYAYHHGHFDGVDREFRGFGMVEQTDAEQLPDLGDGDGDGGAIDPDRRYDVAPVLTATWFHTGAFLDQERVSRLLAAEYHQELDPADQVGGIPEGDLRAALDGMLLADSVWPDGVLREDGTREGRPLAAEELREAARALRGSVLRQEVYARDGSEAEARPYSTSERSYALEVLQPRAGNRHAVVAVHPRETVDVRYERALVRVQVRGRPADLPDPRVSHQLVLETDAYGNVLRSASIAYPRRHPGAGVDQEILGDARDALAEAQGRVIVTLVESRYTTAISAVEAHRAPMPCESRTFELAGLRLPAGEPVATPLVRLEEVRAAADRAAAAAAIPFEDWRAGAPAGAERRRLVAHTRTIFLSDDLGRALPLGTAEPLAIPDQEYELALTPGVILQTLTRPPEAWRPDGRLVPDLVATLGGDGGYVLGDDLRAATARGAGGFPADDPDGRWWIPSGRAHYSEDWADDPAAELAVARSRFLRPRRFRDPFGNRTTITYDRYDLLPLESVDALGNRVTAGSRRADDSLDRPALDYRVLQPRSVMDPNRNRTEVAFDALGMVAGTARMGRPGQAVGDSLVGFEADLDPATAARHLAGPRSEDGLEIVGRASSRLIYDLEAYRRTRDEAEPQPACVYSIARETHDADGRPAGGWRFQRAFAYSDGFGREIQRKAQAEPGPLEAGGPAVDPRWVGTGWTVFNNKGKPARRFEPFFDDTHAFRRAPVHGVSSVLFYDPAERVVAVIHPDGTYEKVVFDAWRHATWDRNDTVDRRFADDPDIAPVAGRYAATLAGGWRSWLERRTAAGASPADAAAASKASAHAATPSLTFVDPLGRTVLTAVHNRFPDTAGGGQVDERHATVLALDVLGNPREVRDVKDGALRTLTRTEVDLAENEIRVASADDGETVTLRSADGRTIRTWDGRDDATESAYDALRRPLRRYARRRGEARALVERVVYGEALGAEAAASGLRTRAHHHYDGAGLVVVHAHDFTGNQTRVSRRLALDHARVPDWTADEGRDDDRLVLAPSAGLAPGDMATEVAFDALDRVVRTTHPNGNAVTRRYDDAGLLAAVGRSLRGDAAETAIVEGAEYNERGQRTRLDWASEAGIALSTTYGYARETFRLTTVETRRGGHARPVVQALAYTYDPAGNVTRVRDDAEGRIFFDGQVVEPQSDYTYDATYRLVEAAGREHLTASGLPDPSDAGRTGLAHPHDGAKMGAYTERYSYDEAGNITRVDRVGGRTRTLSYDTPNAIGPTAAGTSNRLGATQVGGDAPQAVDHHADGTMATMPHLRLLEWDHADRLQRVERNGAGSVYLQYDTSGARVRKVVETQAGAVQYEQVILDGYEIARGDLGDGVRLRETVGVLDGDARLAEVEQRVRQPGPAPAPLPADPVWLTRLRLEDQHGSRAVELNRRAEVISKEEYHPYGSTAFQSAAGGVEAPGRHRFTGKERDGESGLYDFGARLYAPWLGRWTAPDPGGFIDGANRYAFARNNPCSRRDRDGMKSGAKGSSAAKAKPSSKDQQQKVVDAFEKRAADKRDQDTGGRPGLLERGAVASQWDKVVIGSEVAGRIIGKDYAMSRLILEHYLVADGAPLVYSPPAAVQAEIAKRFPRPGHFEDVNPYNWGNPDIRNGLGHFDLDVIASDDGGMTYAITDRYAFPDKDDKGKTVRHGFQVGKLSDEKAKELNEQLAELGEYERESGLKESFELVKTEKSGEYTLYVPQALLADHGVDFESLGLFVTEKPAPAATPKAPPKGGQGGSSKKRK